MSEIKRGDVYWIGLDPTIGSEIKKPRPCVVVSNDVANRFSSLITVLPITSQKLPRFYPHEVSLDSIKNMKNSKVKANQIRTVDKKRVGNKILTLSNSLMDKINWALANHLDLVK